MRLIYWPLMLDLVLRGRHGLHVDPPKPLTEPYVTAHPSSVRVRPYNGSLQWVFVPIKQFESALKTTNL